MDAKSRAHKLVDAQLAAANAAGRALAKSGERAIAAAYVPRDNRLQVELASGIALLIPIGRVQGLADAKPSAVRKVEITGRGLGLYWPSLDLDLSVPDLVAGCFGNEAWMRMLAQHAGRATSPAKAAASRENGKKGGRPRKTPTPTVALA
ncbi:MAG: DUF2442 domain-containing protein [Burkholderiales bacterium]|nr:DUF2442 domain-containing protein [Burkholderiales bacterium]